MAGLVVLDVLLNGLNRCFVVGACRDRLDYDGLGDFTGRFIGDGNDSAVGDGGVSEKVSFEFCGCDLEALVLQVSYGFRGEKSVQKGNTDLDLDKFLDAVDNENMFVALRT